MCSDSDLLKKLYAFSSSHTLSDNTGGNQLQGMVKHERQQYDTGNGTVLKEHF